MKRSFLTIMLLFLLGVAATSAATPCKGAFVEGNRRIAEYHHLLQGKRVGVLANLSSRIDDTHLVDTLLSIGVDVKLIFAPEDGFREDGVVRHRDSYMGIEIATLTQQPKTNDVFRCDVVVCDLQDVGIRTSSSLMALVRLMGVCANIGVPLIVLDRPNPNAQCVDGAIVEPRYRTSKEVLPLPLLHGMTLGELARMINGEGWLSEGAKCPLTVVPCTKSDGEPTSTAKCATLKPFEVVSVGLAMEVPVVLQESDGIDLSGVIRSYRESKMAEKFFIGEEFDRQMGAGYVRDMILLDYSAEQIHSMWRCDVKRFKAQRKPYLIYDCQ